MLTQERLKELLSYDLESGEFRWRVERRGAAKGNIAGRLTASGYNHISIDSSSYYAHRLAWLYVHSVWPTRDIDHIDADKANNRLKNLREVTRTQNLFNTGLWSHNTSGYKGVHYRKSSGKYMAYAQLEGKTKHLGSYTTAELASEAYQAFAKEHIGEGINQVQT